MGQVNKREFRWWSAQKTRWLDVGLMLGQLRRRPSNIKSTLGENVVFAGFNIVGSLRDREVVCSASDRRGSKFESCVWRAVSSHSSNHLQEVLLAQFSLYVHKGGLEPHSFNFILLGAASFRPIQKQLCQLGQNLQFSEKSPSLMFSNAFFTSWLSSSLGGRICLAQIYLFITHCVGINCIGINHPVCMVFITFLASPLTMSLSPRWIVGFCTILIITDSALVNTRHKQKYFICHLF